MSVKAHDLKKSFWFKKKTFCFGKDKQSAPWSASKEPSAFCFQDTNHFQDNWFPFQLMLKRFNFPHHFFRKSLQKMLYGRNILVMTINQQKRSKKRSQQIPLSLFSIHIASCVRPFQMYSQKKRRDFSWKILNS